MSDYTSDRGFKHFDPVATSYGHLVRIYESSAAMAPHIWIDITLDEEFATAHCTIEQAKRIRDNIDACIQEHYQNA